LALQAFDDALVKQDAEFTAYEAWQKGKTDLVDTEAKIATLKTEKENLKALYEAAVEVYKTSTTDPEQNKKDKAARDTAKAAYDAKVKEEKDNKTKNT